jgi:hypothetical protein
VLLATKLDPLSLLRKTFWLVHVNTKLEFTANPRGGADAFIATVGRMVGLTGIR